MQKTVLLLCLSLSACAQGPPRDTGRVRDAIVRQNANAVRWYALGDIESLAGICAEDAWQMPPNRAPLVGREAIRQYWRQAVQWGKWDFTLDTQDVDVSGPLAVERGKYVLRFTAGPGAPPGMASFEDRGNYLVHWRYEADSQWRMVGDAPVSELPLPPSPGPGESSVDQSM
jgi:ketosteroid isomerase-like protein